MKNKNAAEMNPCLKEQEMTYKCFNDNDFNKDLCSLQMHNYNTCKNFWNAVKGERRSQGIAPSLPPLAEREQIKREYFNKFR